MSGGRLIVVGTPIGNLGDMSPRAVEALSSADAIVCEDTRRTGMLLQHTGVDKTPMIVANEHTEDAAIDKVLDRVTNGETVALVTDAGMPAISDPGERIVAAVAAAEIEVTVVPGPTAVSAALATSGLPTARFVFEGFLPRKGSARAERPPRVVAMRLNDHLDRLREAAAGFQGSTQPPARVGRKCTSAPSGISS